ncbi:MAG: hypothetical protein IKG09_01420, partial [Mycoplasmataceae bacterium]|nr:hypothetical protein [Mycoplasmataceae bacterium]
EIKNFFERYLYLIGFTKNNWNQNGVLDIIVDETFKKNSTHGFVLINLIVDKFMILSKINKTRRKMNNHSNQSIKFDLHKQIEELKQNLKSIDEKISNYKIDKIGNNEN